MSAPRVCTACEPKKSSTSETGQATDAKVSPQSLKTPETPVLSTGEKLPMIPVSKSWSNVRHSASAFGPGRFVEFQLNPAVRARQHETFANLWHKAPVAAQVRAFLKSHILNHPDIKIGRVVVLALGSPCDTMSACYPAPKGDGYWGSPMRPTSRCRK